MMRIFFAWVEPTETTFGPEHVRQDERIIVIDIGHNEGGIPSCDLDIRNPRVGFLAPGRKRWAWLSVTLDDSAGAEPLFFGRVDVVPDDVNRERVRIKLLARPIDFDEQKRDVAAALKVPPYWDDIWFDEDRRNDPDVVFEGRPLRWHVDRLTHLVTASHILNGEDGTIALGAGDYVYDSLSIARGQAPVRLVQGELQVHWPQAAQGRIDATQRLNQAFAAAGSSASLPSSLTGEGLADDWPAKGDRIGGGWEHDITTLKQQDGIAVPVTYKKVKVRSTTPATDGVAATEQQPATLGIQIWHFSADLQPRYDVVRRRSERLTFVLEADVQALEAEPGDEETFEFTLSSTSIVDAIDGSDATPIGDVRKRAYFPTDRGLQSVEFGLAKAICHILVSARAVQVSARLAPALALALLTAGLSCRKNAIITDPRIPGGQAAGKIIGYSFRIDGDRAGEITATLTIGCSVGRGNSVVTEAGEPSYVEDDTLEDGIQERDGETFFGPAGAVTYGDFAVPPADDGVDFFDMRAETMIERLEVINGINVQDAAISHTFPDPPAAIEALNAVFTRVKWKLKVLTGGPFETVYDLPASPLMVPKTIDFEAGA